MANEEYYTDADWRYQIVVRLAKESNLFGKDKILPAGAVGKGVGIVDYKSGTVAFGIPNATALFLNLAKRHYDEAFNIAQHFLSGTSLVDDDSFSFLENIMASIVFSYTSLEAFANEEIPESFVYIKNSKGRKMKYNKSKIERSISLGEKIENILPKILKVSSPKGNKVWDDFINLQELRHRIIHMKSVDREQTKYTPNSVWSNLIKDSIPNSVPIAKEIIDYFFKSKTNKPHWYENYPLN